LLGGRLHGHRGPVFRIGQRGGMTVVAVKVVDLLGGEVVVRVV
jgi:hypothetical protein